MEEAYLQVTIGSSVSLSICLECNIYIYIFFFFKSTACFKFLWVNGNLTSSVFGMDTNMKIILCNNWHHYCT